MTDNRQVNMHDFTDVTYWVKTLNTSHEELLQAVAAVGTDAAAIRAYLTRGSDAEPPAAGQRPDGG